LATYFDAIGIPNLFPYFLEFSPVTFKISIKHDQNYTVLSNMPIQKVEINNKNMTMTHFDTTVGKPNYLLFLTNLSLKSSINENVKINMWCKTNCVFAHEVAKNITPYLFNKLKRLNKTWEINHVAIPDFKDKDIINKNLLVYR